MRDTRLGSVPIAARLTLLPLLIGGLTSSARAQITNTWTGMGGNGNWSTTANWDVNGIPVSGAATGIDFTGSAASSNNDLGAFTLNLMQFDVAANITLSGNDLNFVSNGAATPTLTQNTAFGVTIDNNLVLANDLMVNLNGSGIINLAGSVSGAGSLTISGASAGDTVLLSNAGNSYRGGTIIAGGTLQLGADNALPSGSSLQLIGATGSVVDATLDLNGHQVTVGSITFGNGTDTPGSTGNTLITDSSTGSTGLLTLASQGSIIFNGNTNSDPAQINGALALASGQHLVDLSSSGSISNNYYDIVFGGKVSGSGGLDIGTSNEPSTFFVEAVLTNSGNSYGGATNIYQGRLFLGAANALPSTTAVTLGKPATGSPANLYLYIDANRTQSGVKAGSYNQIIGSLADAAGSAGGSVFLGGATLTIGTDNTSTTFSGTILDTDTSLSNASTTVLHGSIVKTGTGTLTIGGANTYSGATTINAGTLQSGITNALPTTTNLTLNGGAFDTNSHNQTLDSVTNKGGSVLVRGGTATLAVTGAYTQSAGTTQVDAALNLTPGKDLTLTGGQLVGVGTVGNATNSNTITVTNSGGTVRPGDLLPSVSVGTLTINGNYTQTSNGKMEIDLSGKTSFDVLKVTSLATLGGSLDVKLLGGYTPVAGDQFNFFDYGTLSGNFGGIVALDPGYTYNTSFANGIGTLIVTAAVPETSTLFSLALLLGAGGLLARRRMNGAPSRFGKGQSRGLSLP